MSNFVYYPQSAESARRLGFSVYISPDNRCDECNLDQPLRYVETDECRNCLFQDFLSRSQSLVIGKNNAIMSGSDGYYSMMKPMCNNGPHARYLSVRTGRCITCQEHRGRRAEAIRNGQTTYKPSARCTQCGTRSLRRTHDDACTRCENPEQSADTPLLIAPVGMTRRVSRELGFKYFQSVKSCKRGHRAPRFVASGDCTLCITARTTSA